MRTNVASTDFLFASNNIVSEDLWVIKQIISIRFRVDFCKH